MKTFLLALVFALPASAQEQVDGPKRIFQDAFIEQLAGDWHLDRKIRGREVRNAVRAQWVLNHQFLQLHMKDVADPPAYEALVYIGYQYADQRYIVHWLDVFGGKFSAIGYGKRSGNSIEFAFQYDDGPFFNTFSWDPLARGWTFTMQSVGKDGERRLFAVDTLRRK
jgi:hypothetical protein